MPLCCDQWERTSVDNRLKTEPFLMRRRVWTNGSLKERCITDYVYVHIFCRSSRDLAFPDKVLQGVRGGKKQLKYPRIFLDKLWRKFLLFFIAYFSLPKSESSVKTISISADDDFSPLRCIFRHRNMFIQHANKYKNRLYIQKYN